MAKTFSEYYAEALAKSGPRTSMVPASAPAKREPLYPTGGTPSAPEAEGPDFFKDPVGATLDFISRPLYGANNVIMGALGDAVEAGKQMQKDPVGGGVRMASEALFNPEILPRFIEGLTTQDDDKRRLGSDVIEEATDKYGELDPTYVDRVDNVNPLLKGTAGFAMDVVADPINLIPGAVFVKGAQLAKGGVKKATSAIQSARSTAKSVDEVADSAVDLAEVEAKVPVAAGSVSETVSPRDAMTIPMPDTLGTAFDPRTGTMKPGKKPKAPVVAPTSEALAKVLADVEATPVAPTTAKVEQALKVEAEKPIIDVAPAVAQAEKIVAEAVRPASNEIRDAVVGLADVTPAGTIPGVTTNVTRRQAQDAYLAVASGAKVTPRRKAIYEYLVTQASAGKAAQPAARDIPVAPEGAVAATPSAAPEQVAPAPSVSLDQEAANIWSGLADKGVMIGDGKVPLTRQHIDQALAMEQAGTLSDEWVENLQTLRTESQFVRDLRDSRDAMRSLMPAEGSKASDALFEVAENSDDAAKWLAQNDINPSPEAVDQGVEVLKQSDEIADRQVAIKVSPQMQAMTPEQIIASSGQAKRMKDLLDTVEMMVRLGEVPAKGAIEPVIPGTKGMGFKEQVISDYAASFDYWVANGLDDLADKNGMVEIPRVQGDHDWVEKVKVSDVKQWLAAVNDVDNYKPVGGSYGPDLAPADYDRLLGVDSLFREEIAAEMVTNPAKEAVEIVNVIDAWQYLIKEKNDFLQTQMGEAGYRYILSQMDGNASKVAQRMATLRTMLEPGYGLDDLKTLKRTARLQETKPVLAMLGEEIVVEQGGQAISLGRAIDEMLHPAVEKAIDPTPTSIPASVAPDPVEAEIVAQPSTITPKPSTPVEVQEVLESISKPSKPQKGKVVESARIEVGDDADLSEVFDVAAGELLATVIGRDIKDIPKVAPHKTSRTRANRTHETPGEGFAWHLKKYNTQNQYTLEAAVWKKANEISERVFEAQGKATENLSKTFSMNRAEAFESMYLELRSRVDTALNKLGVKQVIGQAEALVPLSYFDIFTSIAKDLRTSLPSTDMPKYARLLLFSNGQTRVAPTNLMDAVQTAVWGGTRDDVYNALMKSIKAGGKEVNNFAAGVRKGFHLTLGEGHRGKHVRGSLESLFPGAKFPTTKGNMQWVEIPGEDLAQVLTSAIMRSADELGQKATNNGWRMTERGLTETYDMTKKQLKKLDDLYVNPGKMADFMRGVVRTSDDVADDATATGAYQESADAASDLVRNALGDDVVENAETLVSVDDAVGKAPLTPAINKAVNKRAKNAMKKADEEADAARTKAMLEGNVAAKIDSEDPTVALEGMREMQETFDFGQPLTEQLNAGLGRILGPWAERLNVKHGHERVWGTAHNKSLSAQEILNLFSRRLTHIAQKSSKEDIAQAWNRIQMNAPVKAGDALHTEMASITSALWDPSTDNLFTNVFLSNEGSIEYVNRIIASKFANAKGEVLQFDIGAAKARSMEELGSPQMWPNYLAEQWRALKVNDPLDFLQRMSDAAVTVAERRAVVESFLHNAKKWGALSNKPKPGFMRLNTSGSERTSFGIFLAQSANKTDYPEGLFIERELARELKVADDLTMAARQTSSTLINDQYMPLLNAWKMGMTIYRPGHHLRNAVGDASVTFVVRGSRYFAKSTKNAFKVLAMAGDYTDVDLIKALQAVDGLDAVPPKQGDVLIRGNLGGSPVELTAGQIFSLMHTKGLRPTFHMGEGLYDDAIGMSKTAEFAKKVSLQDTKINEVAGGLSQWRDHVSRAQHFMQILDQELGKGGAFSGKQFSNVKDLDDLFDRAAAEVKKYHPDASMLTPWESKYARPVVPFYTWFAKMLPALIESGLRNPGRVMMFPKASYELAVSMGVNPDTIYDPFPEDQLFPSFLKDNAFGPQAQIGGAYFGANPGFSHLDVFEDLGPDPARALLGMTTPFVRVPLEIAAGGSFSSGARINDTSDYLDSSIPGLNHVANVTGISPTGTLESLLSGTPNLDQQYQVARGNKGEMGSEETSLFLANFLSGMGIQNMSRPNLINYAEFEQKRGEVESK